MKDWFSAVGAMALPTGFMLITLQVVADNVPKGIYYLGFILGLIGLYSFIYALRKSYKEDIDKKEQKKASDDDIRSVKKLLDSIHGELAGLRKDITKWRK